MTAAEKVIRYYTTHGMSLIPCHRSGPCPPGVRPGKGPCLHGLEYPWRSAWNRRATEPEILRWWNSGHNLGIVCGLISRIAVVDLDGLDAVSWARLNLPSTEYRVLTPRGEHWYYDYPGEHVRNHVQIAPGVDVRGDRGYVVAPPSVSPAGAPYTFAGSWRGPWPRFPLELFKGLEPPVNTSTPAGNDAWSLERARAWVKSYPPAVERQGGDRATYTLACWLVKNMSLSDADALELMAEWNAGCVPPWPVSDLERKIANARKYGRGR